MIKEEVLNYIPAMVTPNQNMNFQRMPDMEELK